jgi:hypothetical protein
LAKVRCPCSSPLSQEAQIRKIMVVDQYWQKVVRPPPSQPVSWEWWFILGISATREAMVAGCQFEAGLGKTTTTCLKNK